MPKSPFSKHTYAEAMANSSGREGLLRPACNEGNLTPGEELYAMYGEEYALHRDYEVGEPARSLPKSAIQFECRPAQSRMAHVCKLRGPTCAVLVV